VQKNRHAFCTLEVPLSLQAHCAFAPSPVREAIVQNLKILQTISGGPPPKPRPHVLRERPWRPDLRQAMGDSANVAVPIKQRHENETKTDS
jgi:hypothetical protein